MRPEHRRDRHPRPANDQCRGIPYRIPRDDELDARIGQVLSALYLMFNEGYLASRGRSPARRDIAEDAAWLAELLIRLFPREPEAIGLLALMRLHLARARARFDAHGELGQHAEARAEKVRALALTHNPAEQSLLRRRLAVESC